MSDLQPTPDRQWIENHIPHQGSMCLLDRVARWDESEIVCIARSHARADNPLRSGDSLGIATAIEYAAQAIAVHSALLIGDDAKLSAGFLTSARNVQWRRARLDDVNDELSVHAHRLSGNEMTVLYGFVISAGAQSADAGTMQSGTEVLIDGRISIFLDSAAAQSVAAGLEHLPAEKTSP